MNYRLLHYGTGLLVGALVVVVLTVIGLPDLFPVFWGAAAAVLVWGYFEPPDHPEVTES